MFPFVLLEDALNDVERGFPHKNVFMEQVISEDLETLFIPDPIVGHRKFTNWNHDCKKYISDNGSTFRN